jgi:hypothetical protein
VQIDGVTYYSSSNTFTAAIKEPRSPSLSEQREKQQGLHCFGCRHSDRHQFQEMVDAYNAINEFVETSAKAIPPWQTP